MANTDFPNGLSYVYRLGGGKPSIRKYTGASGAIFAGDIVEFTSSGAGIKALSADAGVNDVVGVALNYKAASASSTDVYVIDDPMAVFEVQNASSSATSSATSKVGYVADVARTTGSTTTGRSKHELKSITKSSPASHALKIVGLSKNIKGNSYSAAHERYLVILNRHVYAQKSHAVV